MAARDRTWTPEKVRQKIRTSMLINRLQNHVAGNLEMSKTQIQAAGILLRKTLPDMQAIEHSGEDHKPLTRAAIDERLTVLLAAVAERIDGSGSGRVLEADGSPPATH